MCVASLWIGGFDEQGIRIGVRATARTTALLLVVVFCTAALRRRFPSALTDWLRFNRRYLGLSAAASHGYHLALLLALYALWESERPSLLTLVGGGLVSLMLLALALTSNNASQRRLGPNWRTLHRLGIWSLWITFALLYFPRILDDPIAAALSLGLVASLLVRTWPRSKPGQAGAAEGTRK
jgi:DMSO/TMAO reductase YedYZ heme-binding membrane subunit